MNTNGIGNLSLSQLQQTSAVDKAAANTSSASTNGKAADGPLIANDQASLSHASTLLAQALTTSSDVRTEKVASLQQAIASGNYHVSSADVADKLINSLLG
jgi:negative regulator of flagellin synthesis FlgM